MRFLRRLYLPLVVLCAFVFVDALLLQAKEGDKQISGDGFYIYMWARSIVFDGDLRLTHDYQLCGDQFELLHWQKPGFEAPNWWGIGGSFAQVPFLLLARLVYSREALIPEARAGCFGPLAQFTMISTIVLLVLTIVLSYRVAVRYVERRHAMIGAAIAVFASPAYCYVYRFSAHNMIPSAFACALFVHEWDRGREKRGWRGWGWLGVLFGFVILVRQQSVVFALLPFVEWLGAVRRDRRAILRGILFAACALVVYLPQLRANELMFGTLGDGRAGSYMFWSEPELAGPLFFSYNGLFTNSPLLYLAFLGLGIEAFSPRDGRSLARRLGVCFLAAAYIVACTWDWWGAAGYPGRRFCDHAITFAVGGAFFASRVERWFANHPKASLKVVAFAALAIAAVWSRNFVPQSGGTSSALLVERTGEAIRSVEHRVGNPLAWPGSIPFGIRHGVHPRVWDRMNYFAVTWEDPMSREQLNRTLYPKAEDHEAFFVSGFWPPEAIDGADSRTVCSEPGVLLVPLFRSNIVRLVVRWRPLKGFQGPLQIRWNGELVTVAENGPEHWITTDVPVRKKLLRRGPNDGEVLVHTGCVALGAMDFYKDDVP